jgi:hypothetical protein
MGSSATGSGPWFIADTGSAVTEPLSMEVLAFLQTLRVDISPRGPIH